MAYGVILGQKQNIPLDTVLLLDGSQAMTGNLNMGNQRITNLANGTNDNDAVTVGQVPSLVGSNFLSTSGGTVNGNIDLNNRGLIINQMYQTARLRVYNYSAATTAVQYNVLGFGCPVDISFSHITSGSYIGDSFFMGWMLYTNKPEPTSPTSQGRVSSRDYELLDRFATQIAQSTTSQITSLRFCEYMEVNATRPTSYITFNKSGDIWTADCTDYHGLTSDDIRAGTYMILSLDAAN